jgi:hypothetical protein
MTLKEVNDEISRLQALQRQMREEEINKHKEIARHFVGKCYRTHKGDAVIKIIGVPRTRLTMTSNIYNEYQFPALVLRYTNKPCEAYFSDDDNFYPCYYDDVYFNLWDDNSKQPKSFYEISKEEFDHEFNYCIEHFKNQINEMVNEYES